ncbi:HD domain-containing phosphohydrolase [Rectinema subterraneum]|jgi:HD-GYP domain-containing protein (c-di-GMP phosphodiesterase class II)|uniref:HD domain-containing phosphohydrolase n=1 Tax=Rectinema subterraneum TaxID=2653714 RepID=UPI00131C8273|nr:HD domain-containing phosphohydrolase [Rectinema subterraneum]
METRKDGSRYHELRQLAKLLDTNTTSQRYLLIRQDITFLKEYRTRLEIDAELPQILANCQTLHALYQQAAAYIRRTFDIERAGFIRLDEQGTSVPPWYGDDMSQSLSLGIIQGTRFPIIVGGTTKALCVVEWKPSFMEGSALLLSYALEKMEQPLARLEAQENAREWMKRLSLLDVFREYFGSGRNFGAAISKVIRLIRETLRADSITLYISNNDGTFACRNYDGFRTDLIKGAIIQAGQKNVGLAAEERRIVAVDDLEQDSSYVQQFRELIAREQFVSQYCVPVILFNEVQAVLELFFRHPFKPDETWLAFAQAAAYQTGLALEFQSVIEELDGAYQELQSANESIIEGLSSALEFRDEETKGHTLRVTALFMSFASRFIQDENELKKLRIGSLLHDIGKIGIPDAILNKPSPLTPEERAVMQKHPLISKEILSRIPSLGDCVDIPLYHHEKYDGTGYPYGLKGEEIPLAARIFAVIDVYEALTSDRPYRKAWSKEKAIEYIRDNAGTHFDPEIALRFMELNL